MTTRYGLQFINGRRRAGIDEGDLPWQAIRGHEYDSEALAWAAADEFDAAYDNRYTHRVVPVEVPEPEPAPEPPRPPVKPTPRRQLTEYRAQQSFQRTMALLEDGLRLGWARVHLDAHAELCEIHLAMSGSSVLTRRWRQKLDALRTEVAARGNLRRVK